jgi:hypothetical protein
MATFFAIQSCPQRMLAAFSVIQASEQRTTMRTADKEEKCILLQKKYSGPFTDVAKLLA